MKKYTATLVGYDTLIWKHYYHEIQVNSEEEAKKWCEENSYMGGSEWHIQCIRENKENEDETE